MPESQKKIVPNVKVTIDGKQRAVYRGIRGGVYYLKDKKYHRINKDQLGGGLLSCLFGEKPTDFDKLLTQLRDPAFIRNLNNREYEWTDLTKYNNQRQIILSIIEEIEKIRANGATCINSSIKQKIKSLTHINWQFLDDKREYNIPVLDDQ
jgi:hypothetical protein